MKNSGPGAHYYYIDNSFHASRLISDITDGKVEIMKTALGYTRISKDDPKGKSVSLDYQRAEIEKYCIREGLNLVRIEEDDGISGKSIKARPAVKRVLQAVDTQAVDAVVVFKSDRLSRDGIESLQIEKLFIRRGVDYLSVTEGSLTSESVDDEFMRYIRAGLNQRERKLIGFRTRQALQRKKERGERVGEIPFGFCLSSDGIHLEPCPEEQKTINRIHKLKSSGDSFRGIARELNRGGYRTKKGGAWNAQQVIRILGRASA